MGAAPARAVREQTAGPQCPLPCVPVSEESVQSWLPAGCAGGHCCLLGMPFLCSSGRDHQASFLPRAKVSLAPRCPLSGLTSWPSSRTSPIGPRCTSASACCWARTGSTGEPASPSSAASAQRDAARGAGTDPALPPPSSGPCSLSPSPGQLLPQAEGPAVGIASWGAERVGPVVPVAGDHQGRQPGPEQPPLPRSRPRLSSHCHVGIS